MVPSSTSSMLGWGAAVMDTESPSQLSPAVIHRMWTSSTAEALRKLVRPVSAMAACPPDDLKVSRGSVDRNRGVRQRLLREMIASQLSGMAPGRHDGDRWRHRQAHHGGAPMFARTSTWTGTPEALARWAEHVEATVRPMV